jgi:tryptophan 2,3-dioxygenase
MAAHLPPQIQAEITQLTNQNSIWDSALMFFDRHGHRISTEILERDKSVAYQPNVAIQEVLLKVDQEDPQTAMVCERLVDIDEGLQEWRYRHVKMVERTIGKKTGTGGSSGVGYLSTTLFNPVFPDLWEIRSRF